MCLMPCNPLDCSPPGSSVRGIFSYKNTTVVAISFSGDLSDPGIKPESPLSPALQAESLPTGPLGKPQILLYYYSHTQSVVG